MTACGHYAFFIWKRAALTFSKISLFMLHRRKSHIGSEMWINDDRIEFFQFGHIVKNELPFMRKFIGSKQKHFHSLSGCNWTNRYHFSTRHPKYTEHKIKFLFLLNMLGLWYILLNMLGMDCDLFCSIEYADCWRQMLSCKKNDRKTGFWKRVSDRTEWKDCGIIKEDSNEWDLGRTWTWRLLHVYAYILSCIYCTGHS